MAIRQGALEGVVVRPHTSFWGGKRVLLTGHTGFKGGWLALWLQRLGADVTGLALAPNTSPSLFDAARVAVGVRSHFCDIRDTDAVKRLVHAFQPEIVLHLAAQPLVRASYRDPLATFSTNVMGTASVLDALRDLASVRVAVMVTTDKVYRNLEHAYPYREDDVLGGHDPYSASKAASEIVIASYRDAFLASQGVALASARAGNVMGGGDWSEDRLIPDAVRAWQSGQTLCIRHPDAIRPWQHVLEPLGGYLRLAEVLWAQPALAGAYNFGPNTHEVATVRDVIELARRAYGQGDVFYGCSRDGQHEAHLLALETAKSRDVLSVRPKMELSQAVSRSMAWYRGFLDGHSARALCESDIDDIEAEA